MRHCVGQLPPLRCIMSSTSFCRLPSFNAVNGSPHSMVGTVSRPRGSQAFCRDSRGSSRSTPVPTPSSGGGSLHRGSACTGTRCSLDSMVRRRPGRRGGAFRRHEVVGRIRSSRCRGPSRPRESMARPTAACRGSSSDTPCRCRRSAPRSCRPYGRWPPPSTRGSRSSLLPPPFDAEHAIHLGVSIVLVFAVRYAVHVAGRTALVAGRNRGLCDLPRQRQHGLVSRQQVELHSIVPINRYLARQLVVELAHPRHRSLDADRLAVHPQKAVVQRAVAAHPVPDGQIGNGSVHRSGLTLTRCSSHTSLARLKATGSDSEFQSGFSPCSGIHLPLNSRQR